MYWYIWWGISALLLIVTWVDAAILSKLRYKRKRLLTPNKLLFAGTFFSAVILLCPVYMETISDNSGWLDWGKSALISIQHSIRLFALDGDYLDVVECITHLPDKVKALYTALAAVLYTFAPLLTFGFILSFFKNASAFRRYLFSFWKNTHVFSELNEKTLALAGSIIEKESHERRFKFISRTLIVFTGVFDNGDEANTDLIDNAREMGAIIFSKDLESIKYRPRRAPRRVCFYLVSENEEDKIRHTESIMRDYDYKNVELYVFSDDIRSELLLASKNVSEIKVIRVNAIQSLIYHDLDENGLRLFEKARDIENGEKIISAVIVGLGKYGVEELKALSWFCQLEGYKLKINAFDSDENAGERFEDICPDLMNSEYNGKDIEGDASYDISIHSGIDVRSKKFTDAFSKLNDVSYIFVCLGDDKVNIETSVRLRTMSERVDYIGDGSKPDIITVVYNSNLCRTMSVRLNDVNKVSGITNFRSQPYNIRMIGDLESYYSVDTLINSELVNAGLKVHLNWGEERDFWRYEYNFRSSIASALHRRLRSKKCLNIPGGDKPWEDRTQEEKLAIGKIEHIRWNAYMRSEGYRYSGSKDRSSRNDLGKLHHNLVPVNELDDDDLRKDV